jgi:hypothetical protein
MASPVTQELSDAEVFGDAVNEPRGIRNNNPLNLKGYSHPGQVGSDGDFAQFATPADGRAAADANLLAYHRKHGINTVAGVVGRWAPPSENDTQGYISQVAQATGFAPNAPLDLEDPSVRGKLLDAMQARETGQPKELSDAEVFGQAPPAAPPQGPAGPQTIGRSRNGGVTIEVGGAPVPQKPAPQPTLAEDIGSGFAQPFVNLGHDVMEFVRRDQARAARGGPPTSLGQAASETWQDIKQPFQIAGDVLGLLGAPVQAAVRPVARAVNNTGVPLYDPSHIQIGPNGISAVMPRRLAADERQGALEGMINTALAGAKPVGPTLNVPRAKPKALPQLQAEKTAAYADVKALGGAYTEPAKQGLLANLTTDLAGEGLDAAAHPGATSVFRNIQKRLSTPGPVSLDTLDKLRQVAWRDAAGLKGPDKGAERFFGQKIIDAIDDFINTATPHSTTGADPQALSAAIQEARDANSRYRKVQTITNELESADLRSSSTYAGGNKANAIRQELRPLLDPTSGRRLKGLTSDEQAALSQVVRGTPAQNAMRLIGKVADPRGLLGASLQVLGVPTHGIYNAITVPVGMIGSAASNRMTLGAAQKLIDLMSTGGVRYVGRPPVTMPTPGSFNPVAPRGLIGVGATDGLRALTRPYEDSKTPKRKSTSAGR